MRVFNEITYQYKKLKDKWVFRHFYLKKTTTSRKPVSKTILIIRIDAIGDCILWLDQAKEYRKAFPNHKLVLLHNNVWTDLAEKLPWFDELIPFERKRIGDVKYYKQLVASLNKYNYEKVFSPVFSRDFITVDWIIHNINAQEKIGFEGDYQNNNNNVTFNLYYRNNYDKINLKEIADNWYSTLVPNKGCGEMEIERNKYFICNTINPFFQSQLPQIPFEIQPPKNIHNLNYTVLFLGAGIIHRTWPVNYFAEVTNKIPFENIVICGSNNDKELTSEFLSFYQGNKTIINLTGKTSIIELISIIAYAKVVVSNETSAIHISVATKTPSICILGGGHYGRFLPYKVDLYDEYNLKRLPVIVTSKDHLCFGCNWKCKYPYIDNRWKCIADINTDDVINALIQSINPTND